MLLVCLVYLSVICLSAAGGAFVRYPLYVGLLVGWLGPVVLLGIVIMPCLGIRRVKVAARRSVKAVDSRA